MNFSKLHSNRSRRHRAVVPAMLAAFVFFSQPTLSLAQQPQAHPATWMSDQAESIANVPLKGIAMLGSHDAAMSIQVPYGDFTKNQIWDFAGQLDRGVRWFDTRIVRLGPVPGYPVFVEEPDGQSYCHAVTDAIIPFPAPGYYLYGHGGPDWCTGVTLPAMLDQISQWLDQHPKEIVIFQLVGGAARIKNLNGAIYGYPNAEPDVTDVNSAAAFEQVLDQHLRRASDHASYIYDLPTACALAGYQYTSAGLYRGSCSGSPILPQEVTPKQLYTTSARVVLLEQFDLGANLIFTSGVVPLPQLTWVDLDHYIFPEISGGQTVPNTGVFVKGSERLTGYFSNGACDPSTEFDRLLNGSIPDNNKGLSGYRPRYQSYESDDKFLTQQAELTPYGAGPNQNLCGVGPIYEAGSFNQQLNSMLQSTWQPYNVNIVAIDRSDDENVLPNVIAYNQQTFGRVPSIAIGVPAIQITAGRDGNVYEVTPGGQVWKRTGSKEQPSDWTPLSGIAADRLAVDPHGTLWSLWYSFLFVNGAQLPVLNNGAFYYGGFLDITSDPSGAIFAVGSDGKPYFITHDASTIYMTQMLGALQNLTAITAGPANTVTVIDKSGNIWQTTNYYSSTWNKIPAGFQANSITADDDGNLWATSSPDHGVWKLAGGSWTRYRIDGTQVSVGPIPSYLGYNLDLVYALSPNGTVHNFRYSLSTGLGAQTPPPTQYAASVSVSGLTFNHARQVFTGTLTVTNTTGSPITDQLAVTFDGLPEGVTIANNPLTYQELPFILMPTVTLQPGESTSMPVEFSNPNLVHINYLTEVYAYVAGS